MSWLTSVHATSGACRHKPARPCAPCSGVGRSSPPVGNRLPCSSLSLYYTNINNSTLPISQVRTQEEEINQLPARERSCSRRSSVPSLFCWRVSESMAVGICSHPPHERVRHSARARRDCSGVRWLVLRGTLALIAIALIIGVPAALAGAKLVKAMLFGVVPADPLTLAGAGAAIAASALLAVWIPSQRAARCDPAVALRCEMNPAARWLHSRQLRT
jgi:hypothetical protein